jgi:hypothetical protein
MLSSLGLKPSNLGSMIESEDLHWFYCEQCKPPKKFGEERYLNDHERRKHHERHVEALKKVEAGGLTDAPVTE